MLFFFSPLNLTSVFVAVNMHKTITIQCFQQRAPIWYLHAEYNIAFFQIMNENSF